MRLVEPGPEHLILYVAGKYAAYAAWCAVGVSWLLSRPVGSCLRAGLAWGLLRLFMGFVFGGILIPEVATSLYLSGHPESLGMYLVVYVPVRIIEWGAMLLILFGWARRTSRRDDDCGFGRTRVRPVRIAWITGGIVISCLADIPVFYVLQGFPIGRFLC